LCEKYDEITRFDGNEAMYTIFFCLINGNNEIDSISVTVSVTVTMYRYLMQYVLP
jgi:hypothetical protein